MTIQNELKIARKSAQSIEDRIGNLAQVDDPEKYGFILWIGHDDTDSEGLSVEVSDKGDGEELRVVRVDCECYPYDDGVRVDGAVDAVEIMEEFAAEHLPRYR